MSLASRPLISIGFPVYNGEKYLRHALSTLLAQDYSNFELVISDNCSRDNTEAICHEFEASDPRIRYIRQPENQGSPWNFAFVLEQAQGDYFMWAAHDDMWKPVYISKCLSTLEAHLDAVLCCTEVNFIDGEGKPSPYLQGFRNLETLGLTPVQRIHQLISRMGWYAIYGLMRPEFIRKVKHLGIGIFGVDVIITLELLLMGHIAKVHEPLFDYRIVKPKTVEDFQADFNSEKQPLLPTPIPYTGLAANLFQVVCDSNLSQEEKIAVFADFICTLSSPHIGWRDQINAEMLGPAVALNDAGFAFLVGQILGRSVPLLEIKSNPLLQALYCPPRTVPDVLGIAKSLSKEQVPAGPELGGEKHQKGALLYGEGKFEESSRMFGEALLEKETSDRWIDWATAQLACKRTAEAECGFQRALALDANNTFAALKLGLLLANLGRIESAIPYLEKSLPGLSNQQRSEVLQLIGDCRVRIASQPVSVYDGIE